MLLTKNSLICTGCFLGPPVPGHEVGGGPVVEEVARLVTGDEGSDEEGHAADQMHVVPGRIEV